MTGMYRKRPVEVEARQFTRDNRDEITRWCGGRWDGMSKPSDPTDVAYWLLIPTLEGVMKANEHDWIIKGVQGEFYPCKPDIFLATYEPVDTSGS